MRLRTLRNAMNLKGKRVLIRIDANVPIQRGKVEDGKFGKIARAAVDLDWLSQRGAKVVIMTHLGRPEGRRVAKLSTKPVARRLTNLIGMEVKHIRETVGAKAEAQVEKMDPGDLLLLENVRFDPREEKNSPAFARALAKLGDIYVNDAFAVCHRAHASVDAITDELPAYAGPLLANEVQVLSKVMRHPKPPVVVAMGGVKLRTKLPVMREFLPKADTVLVGGALATVFLKAQGHEVGKSVYDKGGLALAKKLLKKGKGTILLPTDVRVARALRKGAKTRNAPVDAIRKDEMIVDIGTRSMRAFAREVNGAKTVVWNGPFGYCEIESFCHGTELLAKAVAARTGKAVTVVGGGDTAPFVERAGVANKFSLLSTGGGAMLEFLAGKDLPGINALEL